MEIQRVEKYRYNGKEYNNLRDIHTEIENKIGAIINAKDVTLTPKQRLNILKSIVESRSALVSLLSVEVDMAPDNSQGDMRNILDII